LQKKRREENVAELKAVTDEIRAAVEAATEHEKYVKQIIAERNSYAAKKKEGLNLSLPAETK
jgi:hypothetical protein